MKSSIGILLEKFCWCTPKRVLLVHCFKSSFGPLFKSSVGACLKSSVGSLLNEFCWCTAESVLLVHCLKSFVGALLKEFCWCTA